MLIPVFNPDQSDYEKSYLASATSLGVTSIVVKDSDRFSVNDRIQIGALGAEKTEVVTVSAVAADGITLTVGTTAYPHSADDPVLVLQFDQVKYYRSTTGSTGSYSVISTQNIDVDNETLQTYYDDTTGLSTYYYKVSFYHSIDAIESSLSDPIPGGGYSRNQVGRIVDEVLTEVSDIAEQHITRGELIGYLNDCSDDLTTSASKPFDFLRTRTTLTRTAAAITLDFPTDSSGNQTMWKFDRMDYLYTDTSNNETMTTLRVLPEEEFRNLYSKIDIDTADEDDNAPVAISLDTALDRFRYWQPSATTIADAFYLYYWKYFDVFDSEGDEIETPTPKIYKLFLKWMYYQKRAITDATLSNAASLYQAQYADEKRRYKSVDRKDKGTSRGFRPVSDNQRTYRR